MQNRLFSIIENLIVNEKVSSFLFGSRSQFDDLCHKVVTELKKQYPHIKRICYTTKSETATLEQEREEQEKAYSAVLKKDVRLKGYEEVIRPEKMYSSGKASYVERNQIMIDESDFCVVYYDENYLPPRRKNSPRNLIDYQPKSGTKLAYEYAIVKKKTIVNVIN